MAEKTIAETLQELYNLQEIDTKIDGIKILKGELPIEVLDLEDTIQGLTTRVENVSNSLKEVQTEVARHENNIKEAEALVIKYQSQQDNVKNNREYEALIREIEMQELEGKLSAKKVREGKLKLEEWESALETANGNLEAKQAELEAKKVELEKIIKDTDKAEKSLTRKADKARKGIEDRLLNSYDRIRKAYRNGVAVAQVERDACGGCYNKVPAQIQLEITQVKRIIACEHCGRVLIDHASMEAEATAEAAK